MGARPRPRTPRPICREPCENRFWLFLPFLGVPAGWPRPGRRRSAPGGIPQGGRASLEGGGGRVLGSGAWTGRPKVLRRVGRRRDGFGPGYGGRKQAPDKEKGERRRRAPNVKRKKPRR